MMRLLEVVDKANGYFFSESTLSSSSIAADDTSGVGEQLSTLYPLLYIIVYTHTHTHTHTHIYIQHIYTHTYTHMHIHTEFICNNQSPVLSMHGWILKLLL